MTTEEDAILARLDAEFDSILDEDFEIVDVSQMSDARLHHYLKDLEANLIQRHESLNVTTDEGRELQSKRAAARIEYNRRLFKKS